MGERKYRQRGYMEDDRPERSRGRRPGPRPERDGPRGRGLGAPTESRFQCAVCGRRASLAGPLAADAACRSCGAPLHTCTHCRHFDPSARFECRREVAQRIGRKAAANDCELFEPKEVKVFASEGGAPNDPRAAFDDLFDF